MPVRSMTGFGHADRGWPERRASLRIELRSVNARFLEIKIRQPFDAAVEHRLRKLIGTRLGRGRVDLSVRVDAAEAAPLEDPLGALGVEPERARQVFAALAALSASASEVELELPVPNSLELLRFLSSSPSSSGAAGPGSTRDTPPEFLDEVVAEALARLAGMREREGASLTEVLGALYDELEAQSGRLSASLEGEAERLHTQMSARLEQLVGREGLSEAFDRDRVAQELALLLQRGDVSEELARIASHLAQARGVLAGPAEPGQGKTLEFLGQELLREVTTVGSKITSHEGSAVVIEAKRTIERLREQVQNVE